MGENENNPAGDEAIRHMIFWNLKKCPLFGASFSYI